MRRWGPLCARSTQVDHQVQRTREPSDCVDRLPSKPRARVTAFSVRVLIAIMDPHAPRSRDGAVTGDNVRGRQAGSGGAGGGALSCRGSRDVRRPAGHRRRGGYDHLLRQGEKWSTLTGGARWRRFASFRDDDGWRRPCALHRCDGLRRGPHMGFWRRASGLKRCGRGFGSRNGWRPQA